MKKRWLMALILVSILTGLPAQNQRPEVRFVPLEIMIDSGHETLAAWQFELTIKQGNATIVGIENGEHPAFGQPPYYDPAALYRENRIIVAAFSTGNNLPTGKTRVATVHLRIKGDIEPIYQIDLQTAADQEGNEIEPKISYREGAIQ